MCFLNVHLSKLIEVSVGRDYSLIVGLLIFSGPKYIQSCFPYSRKCTLSLLARTLSSKFIERNHPPGGVLCWWFPYQEPGGKGPHLEDQPQKLINFGDVNFLLENLSDDRDALCVLFSRDASCVFFVKNQSSFLCPKESPKWLLGCSPSA